MKVARLVWTWLALAVLLAATVVITFLPIGGWRQGLSLAIALAKAGLIGWLFMDLKHDHSLSRLGALAALILLAVLAALLSADYGLRAY